MVHASPSFLRSGPGFTDWLSTYQMQSFPLSFAWEGILDVWLETAPTELCILHSHKNTREALSLLLFYHISVHDMQVLVVSPNRSALYQWMQDTMTRVVRPYPALLHSLREGNDASQIRAVHSEGSLQLVEFSQFMRFRKTCERQITVFLDMDTGNLTVKDFLAAWHKAPNTHWSQLIYMGTPGPCMQYCYQTSDQRLFSVQCPHCHHTQSVEFWDTEGRERLLRDGENTTWQCKFCETPWTEQERLRILGQNAYWEASRPSHAYPGFSLWGFHEEGYTLSAMRHDYFVSKQTDFLLQPQAHVAIEEPLL